MDLLPRERTARRHPLEPLSAEEIHLAAAVVRAGSLWRSTTRFVYISLAEPFKEDVLAFEREVGTRPERLARVVGRDAPSRATIEVTVSLDRGQVMEERTVPGVQPSVTIEEFVATEELVRADPRWQEAMRARGVTDFSLCMIDPWSAPNLTDGEGPDDGRFLRPLTWVRAGAGDNGYARPVEGLVVRVDLDTMAVVDLEDHGVVPVPTRPANYSCEGIRDARNVPSFAAGPRRDLRLLDVVQPDGPSFEIDGHHLTWQKWDVRLGFTAREGLVLHQLCYRDGDRRRPVLYRASLSEMFVPYGDPSPTHYRKMVLDEGEYGIGLLTNSLERGCDCLGEIRYLDAFVNDNDGQPCRLPNAICLHEEDHGIGWKHTDFRSGYVEVRRSRRMVISSIVTVGNYEYAFYWYLYQDGSIQYEIKLSGVVSTGAVPHGDSHPFGTVVAPGVYGPNHQHFFNIRLDMTVDGSENRVYEAQPTLLPPGPDNPTGGAWRLQETLLESEASAQRRADPLGGRYWRIVNAGAHNELGQPVAYRLVPGETVAPLCHPGSAMARRAPFTARQLWVTAAAPDEMFATGDYPNQSAGGAGLPAYAAADRSLVDADLVVWHTFGVTHVVRPEDWPVMPVNSVGFRLVPSGFFVGNPALDVAPPRSCPHQTPLPA
jgi:primary-amine oxidase